MKHWLRDCRGTAIAEFTLVFPILMLLLLGVYEVGSAITVNQKTIMASQVIADLVARNMIVDEESLNEAIRAGELAIMPFALEDMGVDIVSLSYDDEDEPQEVWRETRNMDPYSRAADDAVGLGVEGDGALVVTVRYVYRPFLGNGVIGDVLMQETAFARGRRVSVIEKEE